MNTPWSQRITSNDATPMSSVAITPVASPEPMNDPKQRVPEERIAPARQYVSSDHTNGYSHAYQTSASPAGSNAQRCLLEGVCIMDELPTPLPAYVSVAPTASPAVFDMNHTDDLICATLMNVAGSQPQSCAPIFIGPVGLA
ncbi:hypothetical protein P879_06864 [Paragonimus westermani]|uniref:Uncharacterized protein n=1 Tax=Paragonimus westermani TaxID=34504 RepID=A0A8T0DAU2_9TREM|nr:hypothetical protein P879_06864 [Paragonimus westermani]